MVCADADGKCVREVFILIRGFCVVFHMFVFGRKESEVEGQQQRACENMSVGAPACDEKMRKAISRRAHTRPFNVRAHESISIS